MGATFYLGTLAIHWYGLLIALAVVAAISIAIIEAKRRGQPTGQVFNLALIVIPLGAIGAYSIGRFFLEGLKIDVWTITGIPTARWICGIAIITSIAVIIYRRYRIHHKVSDAQ